MRSGFRCAALTALPCIRVANRGGANETYLLCVSFVWLISSLPRMRTEQILAIGFVAASESEPSSLDELASAAGFQVVDGATFAVSGPVIVLPPAISGGDRSALLAAAMGAAAYRWAGSPPGASPEGVAKELATAVAVNRARSAS